MIYIYFYGIQRAPAYRVYLTGEASIEKKKIRATIEVEIFGLTVLFLTDDGKILPNKVRYYSYIYMPNIVGTTVFVFSVILATSLASQHAMGLSHEAHLKLAVSARYGGACSSEGLRKHCSQVHRYRDMHHTSVLYGGS